MTREPGPGMVQCPGCPRQVVSALLSAHLRRHAGTDWFSQRRLVIQPRPGLGSRNRAQAEGHGSARHKYQRPGRPGVLTESIPGAKL